MALFENNNSFSAFNNSRMIDGTKDFLESNSLIAKLAFLFFVIILFILLLRLGTYLLSWIFSYSDNPILTTGMHDATIMKKISTNPNSNGAIPILRSKNQEDGLEFTWSVWIWVKDPNLNVNNQHIFSKGNDSINQTTGVTSPNNAPGLYLSPVSDKEQNLVLVMNTFNNVKEEIVVNDLPIKKWINVIVRCDQHQLDIYINGTMAKRHILSGVPKQNYDDVWVGLNGGFSGYISELRYFSRAIGIGKIMSIANNGPNLNMEDTGLSNKPHYLSTRWFFSGIEDGYNP